MNASKSDEDEVFSVSEAAVYKARLPKYPKILHINVNGLRSRFEDVRHLLINENNIIACGISETKLGENDYTNQFNISGYNFIRKDRRKKNIGGDVGVYIHSSFNYEEIEYDGDLGSIELIIVKLISTFGKPILLGVFYIPPDFVNEAMFQKLKIVLSFLSTFKCEMIVCGDFNVDLLTSSSDSINLVRSFNEINLHQLLNEPTRIATYKICNSTNTNENFRQSSTLIDHIYVSRKDKYQQSGSIPFSSTDHNLVYAVYKQQRVKLPPKITTYRYYKGMENEKFLEEFNKIDWNFLTNDSIKDQSSVIFEKVIVGLLDKFAPLKRKMVKGFNAPWFNSKVINYVMNVI